MLKTIPYYFYQVDAIEDWLDEQAQKGLFLLETRFGTAMSFRRDTPRAVRYRIDVKRNIGYTDEKARIAAYEEMGWEYVCDLTPYLDIYRCDDPAAPELNTDEETLHQVLDKKLRSQILWSIAAICLIPVWLYLVVLRDMPGFSGICGMLLNGYGGLFLCAALLVLSWLINSIACIIGAVTTRRRRLLQRTRRSPAQLRRWRAIRLSAHLLPLAALALCLVLLVTYTRSGRDIPVTDFPAPTVSEVFPGMQSNHQWATVTPEPLSRHRYLRQKDLTLSNFYDGGYYDVDVYRIAWTWLAEGYAREQAQEAGAETIAVPGWEHAWYAADADPYGGQLLVLQEGKEVWRIGYDGGQRLTDALDVFART